MMPHFTAFKLFSEQSREHCLEKLKRVRIPISGKIPKATAAVLVPLCVVNGTVSLLYTVRSMQLRNHSGQISFPGGKTDNNETPIDTAIREAHEEIGVKREEIHVWGTAPAVPGRNNAIMITPVIASIDLKEELRLNSQEVRDVFTVPLPVFCDQKNHFHTQFRNGFILPVFLHDQYRIWGVTAYMTHVFLTCLLPKDVYKNNWMQRKVSTHLAR